MSRLGSYVLCAALCSLVVLGQGDITTEKPVTLVIPKDPSSTTPTEVPIERKKTTTTEPTTTTTEPTTTSTTTTSTTTTSTTTTTTTPAPPAPTPKPTPPGPLPLPEQGTWSYMENNITCIVVQFAAQLNVTYTKAVEKSASLANVVLNIPANATVSNGDCNGTNQWLQLSWPAGAEVNNLTLVFHRNDTTKNYALQYLNISLANSLFPNASTPTAIELTHGSEWMTPLATSYRCTPASRLNMTADSANVVAALTLSRLQEEAFRTSPGKGFSAARECGGGDIPDTVPIVVGCALGGLVVVVLVAYLAARHRSRGYVSM